MTLLRAGAAAILPDRAEKIHPSSKAPGCIPDNPIWVRLAQFAPSLFLNRALEGVLTTETFVYLDLAKQLFDFGALVAADNGAVAR